MRVAWLLATVAAGCRLPSGLGKPKVSGHCESTRWPHSAVPLRLLTGEGGVLGLPHSLFPAFPSCLVGTRLGQSGCGQICGEPCENLFCLHLRAHTPEGTVQRGQGPFDNCLQPQPRCASRTSADRGVRRRNAMCRHVVGVLIETGGGRGPASRLRHCGPRWAELGPFLLSTLLGP